MNLGARNLARKILSGESGKKRMPVDRLTDILSTLRRASGLDTRQPVLLRRDDDGLFALLPEERGGDELALCTCWCLGDKEICAAYPGRSFAFSEMVVGEDGEKILDFLRAKGYTDLWVADHVTKVMHNVRAAS